MPQYRKTKSSASLRRNEPDVDSLVRFQALRAAARAFDGKTPQDAGADGSRLRRVESVRFVGSGNPLTRSITRRRAPTVSPIRQSPSSIVTALPAIRLGAGSPRARKLQKARSMVDPRREISESSLAAAATRTPRSGCVGLRDADAPSDTPAAVQYPALAVTRQRRPTRQFRRTVRSSSTTSYGNAVGSAASVPVPRADSLGQRARDISCTVRRTIRKVFARDGSSTVPFPKQQVNARRPHFGDYAPGPGPAAASSTGERPLCGPSPQMHFASFDGEESPAASVHSVGSIRSSAKSKSRVTSWEDSSAENTIRRLGMIERKRLSVIQEHGGPHQPSSSAGLVGNTIRRGYDAFRRPLRRRSQDLREPVDPKRLVSALQRQMEEQPGRRRAEHGIRRVFGSSAPGVDLDGQSSDLDPVDVRTPSRLFAGGHGAWGVGRRSGSQSPSAQYDEFSAGPYGDEGHAAQALNQDSPFGDDHPALPHPPLREVRSTFFTSTAMVPARTTSPYRRAMRESMERDDESRQDSASIYSRQDPSLQDLGGRRAASQEYGTAYVSSPFSIVSNHSGKAKENERTADPAPAPYWNELNQSSPYPALEPSPSEHRRRDADHDFNENDGDHSEPHGASCTEQYSSLLPYQPLATIDFVGARTCRPPLQERKLGLPNFLPRTSSRDAADKADERLPSSRQGGLRRPVTPRRDDDGLSTGTMDDSEPPAMAVRSGNVEIRARSAASLERYSPERAARLQRMQKSLARLGKENANGQGRGAWRDAASREASPTRSDAGDSETMVRAFLEKRSRAASRPAEVAFI